MTTDEPAPARRIAPPRWSTDPPTRRVMDALQAAGIEGRFVGGCVRNTLLHRAVTDIDIAVAAEPGDVIAALEAAKLRAIPTGIEHGTVTAIANGHPFELTSLRRDVATDGRRATIAYTDCWREDAERRDFTLNALFLDRAGHIFDPVDGLADLEAGRVRFIGDPARRLQEDRLRLLRFFRIHAFYGRGALDPEGLEACRAASGDLGSLSGERVRDETLKLLSASDPVAAWRAMADIGAVATLYPALVETEALARLVALEAAIARTDPLRRLAALHRGADVETLADALRLSNRDKARLAGMRSPPASDIDPATGGEDAALRRALYRLGRERAVDRLILHAAAEAADPQAVAQTLARLEALEVPALPVTGGDLIALGIARGPEIGAWIARLTEWWEEAGYRPDRDACLDRLKQWLSGTS